MQTPAERAVPDTGKAVWNRVGETVENTRSERLAGYLQELGQLPSSSRGVLSSMDATGGLARADTREAGVASSTDGLST